jgi:hypothetical protein
MKKRKQQFCCLLACAAGLLFGLPQSAMADLVVYDNGAPNHVTGHNMGFARQAEDFSLSADYTLTDVHFWSLEASGAYRGSISWSIMTNSDGKPDRELATGTQSVVTRTNTGSFLDLTEFSNAFNLNAPVMLGAGTYWLVLHNGSFCDMGDPNEYLWETSAANSTTRGQELLGDLPGWETNSNEHAFQITAVPEPATVVMLLAGIVLTAGLRRRELRSDAFVQ